MNGMKSQVNRGNENGEATVPVLNEEGSQLDRVDTFGRMEEKN
jgi:hypothetical protein